MDTYFPGRKFNAAQVCGRPCTETLELIRKLIISQADYKVDRHGGRSGAGPNHCPTQPALSSRVRTKLTNDLEQVGGRGLLLLRLLQLASEPRDLGMGIRG